MMQTNRWKNIIRQHKIFTGKKTLIIMEMLPIKE